MSNADIAGLCSIHKQWIVNIPDNSRARTFIKGLGVETFTIHEFLPMIFDSKHQKNTEQYLSTKSKVWLWNFYNLCRCGYSYYYIDDDCLRIARKTAIVLGQDGFLF